MHHRPFSAPSQDQLVHFLQPEQTIAKTHALAGLKRKPLRRIFGEAAI
jgi:hypothetical protein